MTLTEDNETDAAPRKGAASSSSAKAGKSEAMDEEEEDEEEEDDEEEDDEEDDEEEEEDEEDEKEEDEGNDKAAAGMTQGEWDEQRFLAIAAKKYSKTRVVGSTSDRALALSSASMNDS